MLDKFLVLLERFVVAHELIAANSTPKTGSGSIGEVKELPVEGEDVIDAPKKAAKKAKPAPEPEDEPEEKPARKPRKAKEAVELEEVEEVDLAKLRKEIKEMATIIAEGEGLTNEDADDAADAFDDLLEDFKVRTVTKLADEDVPEFHKLAKKLTGKYFEIED